MNISLQPVVLKWARERAGLSRDALAKKMGVKAERIVEWEAHGELRVRQAEKLAHVTHTPLGQLYLEEPTEDKLPIPDFRTVGDAPLRRPTPDLLETVQTMQRRQAWMRDFLIEEGEEPLPFVGSASLQHAPEDVAASMRDTLGMAGGWAQQEKTWTSALQHLREKIEAAGMLIVVNGVVGNNNFRKLDPDEFRGFVLSDEYAPLIFINGADFKAPQMFTFAHELAHIWLAKDGVSNFELLQPTPVAIERFCNKVAAEFLVPATALRECWDQARQTEEPYQFLARRFKVSSIVAARRALDLELINKQAFCDFYHAYEEDELRKLAIQKARGKSSRNFWNTQKVRIGQRFGAAVVRAAKEGRLLYREAYHLTGLRGKTFDSFANQLGYRVW